MADTNFNSSMQLPDANSEVEIEAIVPYEVLNRNVAEAVRSMENKVKKISPTQTRPFIYRVHKKLRDVNEKAYEPTLILAIGPYHLGKENLKMMEEHKWRYLKELLDRRPDINFENYIAAVAQVEQVARDCYAEPLNYINSPEFIEMLVLDGCFIIELMQKYNATYTVNDPIFQSLWIPYVLVEDLMLFENQIPFFVLCKLFNLIDAPNQRDRRGIGWHLLKAGEDLITKMSSSREVHLQCRVIDEGPFNMYKKAGYSVEKTDSILTLLKLQRRRHLMRKEIPISEDASSLDIPNEQPLDKQGNEQPLDQQGLLEVNS